MNAASADNGQNGNAPAETNETHDSVWTRILDLFSGIKNDIAAFFRRDSEEAAEL